MPSALSAQENVRLAEFGRLRDEIGRRTAIQQALIALNLTVAGTLSGVVTSDRGPASLLIGVAVLSATFGVLWLDHHLAIHQIAAYIKKELWIWEPSWETYIDEDSKPAWWRFFFLLAMTIAFSGVSLTALVAARWAHSNEDMTCLLQVLWWLATAYTAGILACYLAVFLSDRAKLR